MNLEQRVDELAADNERLSLKASKCLELMARLAEQAQRTASAIKQHNERLEQIEELISDE